jgi:hypothetical protein
MRVMMVMMPMLQRATHEFKANGDLSSCQPMLDEKTGTAKREGDPGAPALAREDTAVGGNGRREAKDGILSFALILRLAMRGAGRRWRRYFDGIFAKDGAHTAAALNPPDRGAAGLRYLGAA